MTSRKAGNCPITYATFIVRLGTGRAHPTTARVMREVVVEGNLVSCLSVNEFESSVKTRYPRDESILRESYPGDKGYRWR